MYLYFDSKGVLLEVINDEALRQYNYQVNTMYVYIENPITTEFPDGLKYLQYWFERPNGDETEVYDTQSHPGDEVVTETIPFDTKRDVRKFKYGIKYKMHKITIPSGRVIDTETGAHEYNMFEDDGPVSLTIKAIYERDSKELTLGKVVFTIEKEVVIPSDSISVPQFEYLLRAVDALTFTVGKVETETLEPTEDASVTVTLDKSDTSKKNYPTDFKFGIPKGATFTPSVSEDGDISWTNDGGLDNPETVNIKGEIGPTPDITASATIDANVGVPEVEVVKSGTAEEPHFTFGFKNLRGKDATIPQELTDHLTDYNNPHRLTTEQINAVPIDFRSFTAVESTPKSFRQLTGVFVENEGKGFRMTLQQVKDMGTKIITVKDIKTADLSNLDVGDYVYSEK